MDRFLNSSYPSKQPYYHTLVYVMISVETRDINIFNLLKCQYQVCKVICHVYDCVLTV
jgi:hypothetical protein